MPDRKHIKPTSKPKAIIFDVDKTLTDATTWYTLTKALGGNTHAHAQTFFSFLNGKITYQEMKVELFKIWLNKGPVSKQKIQSIVQNVQYTGEALSTFRSLQERGYPLVLISSSFDTFIEEVAKRFEIKHWYANCKFIFDKNDNWIDLEDHKDEAVLKVKQLKEFLKKSKIKPEECMAIGDGENDIELFKIVPGIAFRPATDHLTQVAWQEVKYLPRVIQIIESI